MRSLIVYESMYGNTHLIADAIGRGLADSGATASVVPVEEATTDLLAEADLVVIGGPTHVHGMSRERTRDAAVAEASKPDSELHLDPDAEGEGLREWFETLTDGRATAAAAYDTRIHMTPMVTGRASKGISRRLRHHGFDEIAEPESFFVSKTNTLEADEERRATDWGRTLAERARDAASMRAGSHGHERGATA